MALTRKSLKAMGLADEQIDSVIEMHAETVEALKEQREAYKADAEKLAEVQAELDAMKNDGYKSKYENEHSAFEAYKADVTARETKTAKTAAVRKYFEAKGITGKSLGIAMRGAGAEIDAAELDGDDLKDTTALDTFISGVDGMPSMLLMNSDMLLKVRACARCAGYYERDKDDFGRFIEYYKYFNPRAP